MTSEVSQHDYFIGISFSEQTYAKGSLPSFSLILRLLVWQKKDNVKNHLSCELYFCHILREG